MGSATTQSLISVGATLCLIMIQSTPANSSNDSPTAYEVLHDHNFPVGLLPKGFTGYNLGLIMIPSTAANTSTDSRTAYEVLEDYNFPVGLLPKGITGYDINSSTGKFSVYFNDTCSFSLESSYKFKYNPTIKGYISNGKISSLEGVYVRLFLVWMEIVEILWSEDDLVFTVGIVSAAFPIDHFKESPQCGCGLNCGDSNYAKLTTNPCGLCLF